MPGELIENGLQIAGIASILTEEFGGHLQTVEHGGMVTTANRLADRMATQFREQVGTVDGEAPGADMTATLGPARHVVGCDPVVPGNSRENPPDGRRRGWPGDLAAGR